MKSETHGNHRILIGAAQAITGLLLAWVPLPFGSVQPAWIFGIEAVVALLLVLWLIAQVARGYFSLIKTGLAWPFLLLGGYFAFTLVSISPKLVRILSKETSGLHQFAAETIAALGKSPSSSFRVTLAPFETEAEMLKLASYVLFFFLVLNLFRYRRAFLWLYRLLIGLGAGIGLYGIIQNVWWNGKIYWTFESGSGTPFGPFVNHNHFAGYLELSLGLSIGMFLGEIQHFRAKTGNRSLSGYLAWLWHREGGQVWILGVATFIMVAALTVSLSRGGLLSFVSAAFLFSGIGVLSGNKEAEGRNPNRGRYRLILILASFCAIALVIAVLGYTPRVRGRFRIDESVSYRLQIWRDSLKAIADFPLTGAGLGSFHLLFPRYKTSAPLNEVTHAENEYLQWLVEAGPAGTALILYAGWMYVRMIYRRFTSRRNAYARCLASGTLFSITSLSIHNLMDFNTHIPSNALTLAAVIALSLLVLNHREGNQRGTSMLEVHRPQIRSIGGIFLTILTLLVIFILGQKALSHFRGTQLEQQWDRQQASRITAVDDENRFSLLAESLRWSPLNSRAHFLMAAALEAESARQGLFLFDKRRGLLSMGEAQILEAIRLCPGHAVYWTVLGRIEASLQNFVISERSFLQAIKLARNNGFFHREYGLALLLKGKALEAAAQFKLARTYQPSLSLREMLQSLSEQTTDRDLWESILRLEPADLKEYAVFLESRGQTALATRFRRQAEDLEKRVTLNR